MQAQHTGPDQNWSWPARLAEVTANFDYERRITPALHHKFQRLLRQADAERFAEVSRRELRYRYSHILQQQQQGLSHGFKPQSVPNLLRDFRVLRCLLHFDSIVRLEYARALAQSGERASAIDLLIEALQKNPRLSDEVYFISIAAQSNALKSEQFKATMLRIGRRDVLELLGKGYSVRS